MAAESSLLSAAAECKRLREAKSSGPTCSCHDGTCALDIQDSWEHIFAESIIHDPDCPFVPPLNDGGDGMIECECYVATLYVAIEDAVDAALARVAELETALRQMLNGRLLSMPGVNPDGSVSTSSMAETLARAALGGPATKEQP